MNVFCTHIFDPCVYCDVNTTIPELSDISSILEKIEASINDVNKTPIKQERKALKELQYHQNIVKRKTDKGNALVLMEKGYCCNTLIMNHHLSTKNHKEDSNRDKRALNNLKFVIKKRILLNLK